MDNTRTGLWRVSVVYEERTVDLTATSEFRAYALADGYRGDPGVEKVEVSRMDGMKRRVFRDLNTPLGQFLVQFDPQTNHMELAWRRAEGDTWGPPMRSERSDDD